VRGQILKPDSVDACVLNGIIWLVGKQHTRLNHSIGITDGVGLSEARRLAVLLSVVRVSEDVGLTGDS
jgi:hypothetical protein